ncbi:MAG: putative toxin-antitoxin system toxin component, PIN family [Candidatus Marinimicrobia bacterium]|nr:putative toxin-antitoxin system toxin component, PIN family [Candidatus Neomarinimicrobiota bacterium]
MKVVVDTNVMISGVFFGGKPRQVLELWYSKRFELLCSPEILEEYEDVLYRLVKRSRQREGDLVHSFMLNLSRGSTVIEVDDTDLYSSDPDDDKFVQCAVSGKALFVVSGDSDLLELGQVKDVEIITVNEFLERMSN